jgi:hypothetical protein
VFSGRNGCSRRRYLNQPDRPAARELLVQERQGDVVDGSACKGSTFEAPVVSMPVKHRRDFIAVQWFLQPARAEKRKDLGGLPADRIDAGA